LTLAARAFQLTFNFRSRCTAGVGVINVLITDWGVKE